MKSWMSIAVVAVACGGSGGQPPPKEKTLEELKPQWGAKVQAKLEKIVAAAKAASTGELGTPGDAKLALDFEWSMATNHPNAIAVQIDDVQSATAHRPEKSITDEVLAMTAEEVQEIDIQKLLHPRFTFQDDGHSHVFKAKALLGVPNAGGQYREYLYDQFVNAKYLLVVTPGELQWATVEGTKFQSAYAPMTAMLIEIDTAKPMGGFKTIAESSDTVLVNVEKTGITPQEELDRNLLGAASRAIAKGIEQRWPGAKTPYSWDF